MLLIDRKSELEWLEKAYKSEKAEFVVIYGRRRLGKTFLVKYFISKKPHFYFLAKQRKLEDEFVRMKEKFSKNFNIFLESENFEEFFEEIFKKIKIGGKLVFVIDEFPYWIKKSPEVLSEFQYVWDEILKEKNILLILMGSYVSMMEKEVLSYKSPLYGRKTSQIYLKEMPINALIEFYKTYKLENILKIYGLTDTIPYYMEMIKKEELKENLLELLNPNHNYHQDAEVLLKDEVREYITYLEIMKAINEGHTKLNEIANKAHVDITNLPKYLKVLQGMRLIGKIKPITAGIKEKNYLYVVSDNYFKFWLSFIYPYKEEIEENLENFVDFVMERYNTYMGKVFEKFCLKSIPFLFNFSRIGKWWYKDKEIDILALNEKEKKILFGEVKWKENVDAKKVLKELVEKAKYVKWHNEERKEEFILFAKSFKRRIDEFEGKRVYCFDLKDLERMIKKDLNSGK